ncbi:MAG: vitamin K epoxide reductase family protein [Anaerolineales bacterium]
MTRSKHILALLLFVGLLLSWTQSVRAETQPGSQEQPVVRVVMFWLSTCGHCEYVINEVLPPLQDQYEDQLEVLLIELVTQEDVDRLYETANLAGIPSNNVGVPFMLVGDRVLKGSNEIPSELPGLIEQHLANGGLDYPRYPTLESFLPEPLDLPLANNQGTSDETEADQSNASTPQAASTFPQDETGKELGASGFTVALMVLIGMMLAMLYVFYALLRDREHGTSHRLAWLDWLVPIVALVGIGVAGYMTYVETTEVEAICGPLGDCNAVQNSTYASIFGVLPVGVLGLIGYSAILIAWLIQKVRRDRWGSYATLAMLGMAIFGTLYSIYLTYLELWVIRAVCVWCVGSAVLITILMLLSIHPATSALDSLGEDG